MSIESNKLMNLADGKVLYDDLRARVDQKSGAKPIVFALDNVSNTSGSYSHTTTVAAATATMKPIALEVSNPAAFLGNITVTCANGSITLSCPSVEGTSTVSVTVEELAQNAGQSMLTSEEFVVLDGRIGPLSSLQTTEKGSLVGAVNENTTAISSLSSDLQGKIDEPASEGTSGQFLCTDGSGGRTWATPSGGGSVTVDSALSASSTNPVQNKVITNKINEIIDGTSGAQASVNRLNLSEVAENKYIKYTTGELVDNNEDNTTGFIEVTGGKSAVAFTGKSSYNDNRVCLPIIRTMFYDGSKNIIGHTDSTASNNVCTLANGTVYVRLATNKTYYSGRYPMVEFVNSKNDISATYVEYSDGTQGTHGLDWSVETLEDLVSDEQAITELGTFANGSINSGSGAYQNWNNYRVSTPNQITATEDYVINIEFGFRVYLFYFDSLGGKIYSGWAYGKEEIPNGSIFRMMIARTTEDTTETADVDTFCSKVKVISKTNINRIAEETGNINAITDVGMTWDWWITANGIDSFGNVYIGFVDSEGFAGVLRRQPDGVMQYKRLEKSNDNDDHNGMATIVLDDGRVLVIGSYGHSINNHIICWRSKHPYSISDMEKLSFDIPQTDYTYKTCYSQVFKYDGKLFDFMRFGSCPSGGSYTYGYACLISTDNGSTWTPYKVFNGTDAYQGIAQATDDEKYLKVVVAANPSGGNHTFKGCYIDLSTYKIYDLSDTEIGQMVALNGGAITDDSCPTETEMTVIIDQTITGSKGRLFFTGRSVLADTVFLYATADDSQDSNFTYKLYDDGTVVTIAKSGTPFGNHHYLSGMCFGKDLDTIYYATSTDSNPDGNHELHKVKIESNAVSKDEIIAEASMCILRPLFLGNGEIASVVGHYNDVSQSGTFTAWELKPLFVHA